MASPFRRKHKYRLTKHSEVDDRPTKRFKSTGDDFVLRNLKYGDKKNTNDEIHATIELCPVSSALIDTEVFQRLRNIFQLGASQHVYTCANHNRFQHSLGVAYLAEKLCRTIKEEQPELGATDKDVLCVKLAGLLHDIGHGPYSHLYESFRDHYLPKFLEANPDLKEEYTDCEDLKTIPHWSHEQSSLVFIDAMLKELGLQIDLNNLDEPLLQIGDGIDANSMRVFKPPGVQDGILTSRDFLFIKECILGKPLEGFNYFVGRPNKKLEWLYDIVSNRHSGLDVDKIDYFARDHTRAISKRDIFMKTITDARVAKGLCPTDKGKTDSRLHYMICYPEKHVTEVMHFFAHRLFLHKTIYQHKTNSAVENMICDILCLADPYIRIQSHEGENFPISRAYLKSDFLVRIDDNILTLIAHSTDERLQEARDLCQRFRRRDFYKCAVDKILDIDHPIHDIDDLEGEELKRAERTQRDILVYNMSESEIHEGMLKLMKYVNSKDQRQSVDKVEANDFIVKKYCMHHGAGSKNPLMRVRFFEKMSEEKLIGPAEDLPTAKPPDESKLDPVVPKAFRLVGIRMLVRDNSKRETIYQLFETWMLELEATNRDTASNHQMEPTSLFYDAEEASGSDIENGEFKQRGTSQNPAMLSQDFEDSGEETEEDNMFTQQDVSPIPIRARTR